MFSALLNSAGCSPLWAFIADTDVRWLDRRTILILSAVLGLLAFAFVVGWILKRQPEAMVDPAMIRRFNYRVRAWWMMYAILALGIVLGRVATVVLFGLISFWALREFVTMTPTRRGDHRALFWTFFLFTPLQFVLVGIGRSYVDVEGHLLGLDGVDFYGLYAIMIPVYASLLIPARIAISGDHKRFLERTAKIQAGLLICVYSLSYAPALLDLDLSAWQNNKWVQWSPKAGIPTEGSNPGLLVYFILIVHLSDGLQYIWGKMLGRHVVAPAINASKTWEGFIGGSLSTALVGLVLWKMTPFSFWGSACMAWIIAVMGFAGSMTMSAIKRDRGVQDYGTLVQGHVGVLDRIDSLCFAAPVFFHLTRLFFYVLPNSSAGL